MSALLERTECTPEQLLAIPDGERYELVNGRLAERTMSLLSSIVGSEILGLLRNFVHEHRLGWTANSDCGYQCFPWAPNQVRRPDASFIARERLSADQLEVGYVPIPPDLAVEVVSPNDLFSEVVTKVEEYLRAGVRLVWVIDPTSRSVYVYEANNALLRVREEEELSGGQVLPGFRCTVGQLFPERLEDEA